jgi:hypothetical protein
MSDDEVERVESEKRKAAVRNMLAIMRSWPDGMESAESMVEELIRRVEAIEPEDYGLMPIYPYGTEKRHQHDDPLLPRSLIVAVLRGEPWSL